MFILWVCNALILLATIYIWIAPSLPWNRKREKAAKQRIAQRKLQQEVEYARRVDK